MKIDRQEIEKFLSLLSDDENVGFYIVMMYRGKYVQATDLRNWFPSSYILANDFVKKSKILAWIEAYKHLGINKKLVRKDQVYDFIPIEGLCFYINPNPMKNINVIKNIAKNFVNYGFTQPDTTKMNIMSEIASCISKTKTVSQFRHYDFDFVSDILKTEEKIEALSELEISLRNIVEDAFCIIRTRGGFHVLIEYKYIPLDSVKTWFLEIQNMKIPNIKIDTKPGKELLLPIPGTPQGKDFLVELR